MDGFASPAPLFSPSTDDVEEKASSKTLTVSSEAPGVAAGVCLVT
jgi:hypothetical protein